NGGPQIPGTPGSLAPTSTRGVRPNPEALKLLEVAPERLRREHEAAQAGAPRSTPAPPPHVAAAPPNENVPVAPLPRPSFGHGTTERPMTDRKTSPPVPPSPNGTFSGPVPSSHTGAPTPAGPALNTEPGKGPTGRQPVNRSPEPVPPRPN